jgi:hypothetical protein
LIEAGERQRCGERGAGLDQCNLARIAADDVGDADAGHAEQVVVDRGDSIVDRNERGHGTPTKST